MFKVVPDQLRISEGWVRCGQCTEVFDATASLLPPEAAQQQVVPETAAQEPGEAEPPITEPTPLQPASVAVAPAPTLLRASPAEAQDSIDAPPLYPWFPSEVRDSQLQREQRDDEPDLDEVSFVRHARRRALAARPLVRTMLVLLVPLLAALLVLQYAVHERDRLAALHPALRPWLQRVCEPVRCQIGPPRQIDAIVIDSSSFSRLRSDAYRLSFTVRNLAPMQVAMPSLELTLTDTQDQPVIRRVLAPRDVGAAPAIPAVSDSAGSVAVAVSGTGTARVAGYRLLAFYP